MAEAETKTLVDLPLDILLLIFPYLDARSFLSLCRTCKAFQQPQIRLDSAYWSHATQLTFRVPNRPVVQNDGQRWHNLYKRLLTQSRVYTWGSNTRGCLGYGEPIVMTRHPRIINRRQPARLDPQINGVPREMQGARGIGVIADLQCGGWSTTLLNDKGELYLVGKMNGQQGWNDNPHLNQITFPGRFAKHTGHDPNTAIRQFSSGRMQVVGVADSGFLWLWYNETRPAIRIKFLHHDIQDGGERSLGDSNRGYIRQVVAGWNKNSALVSGIGVILWGLVDHRAPQDVDLDMMLINETAVVPNTSYTRPKRNNREPDEESHNLGKTVGQVTSYILLENYVVFVTDLHRVFCCKIIDQAGEIIETPSSLEILSLQYTSATDQTPCVTDVHGTFHTFALLKSTGEVLVAQQGYLDACWALAFEGSLAAGDLTSAPLPSFLGSTATPPADSPQSNSGFSTVRRIPALQNSGVIAMAFGDYHFHALHSSGSITSYGAEPQSCGCLGLGPDPRSPRNDEFSFDILRGSVKDPGFQGDNRLLPHAYTKGREIWFQDDKYTWLSYLTDKGHDFPSHPRAVRGELSEWVEQKGRGWDRKDGVRDFDQDGLGAHFALSVAAAGWHSGALVLVNDDLVRRVRESCILVDDTVKEGRASEGSVGVEFQEGSSSAECDLAGTIFNIARDFGRSFLGLPVAGQASSAQSSEGHAGADQHGDLDLKRFPKRGYRYVWADDAFPRLQLSDDTEMQGEGPLTEWPEGRPQWDLSFDL